MDNGCTSISDTFVYTIELDRPASYMTCNEKYLAVACKDGKIAIWDCLKINSKVILFQYSIYIYSPEHYYLGILNQLLPCVSQILLKVISISAVHPTIVYCYGT